MYSIFLKLFDLVENTPAKRDHVIFPAMIVAVVLNIANWLAVLFGFWNFKEYIILQYNVYFGISSFGAWQQLLLLPLAGLIIGVIDFLWSFRLYLEYRVLSRVLAVTAVVLNLILLLAISLLIYMNM